MPALLMHVRAAEALREGGALPEPLRSAAERHDWAYRLGSGLVDLPLFDQFYKKVALFLVHRPYPESLWATAIHAHGSASIGAGLLRRAPGAREGEITALVAGLMTHLAFDREMHPPIEEAVDAHLRPDESHAQLHEALENYQCMVWHRSHRGCDGLGTAALRDGVTVGPGRSAALPRWLAELLAEVLAEVYGVDLEPVVVSRWARGMSGYRDMLSTRAARISIRSSERFARRRPWAAEVELETAWNRGLARARNDLEAAAEVSPGDLPSVVGDGPLV